MNKSFLLRAIILLLAFVLLAPTAVLSAGSPNPKYKQALPGYKFNFPRDYASHNEFKTEWWYYTGHLHADDGTVYGYELTFFRIGMDVPGAVHRSPWAVDDAYMAHFAVSDLQNKRFFHTQRLTRSGLQFAGAEQDKFHIWNTNWSVTGDGAKQNLRASSDKYSISLNLTPDKPAIIHGDNGVSQKADCVGCASHYYSFTRLGTDGYIIVDGRRKHVRGLSWMDHEFGSNQLTADQVGWDWFSIQLDDRTELMLYVMRRKDGSTDPHSSGTLVTADGKVHHLALTDYAIRPLGSWRSKESGATYPMGWNVSVPSAHLNLNIKEALPGQELTKGSGKDVTYWEGTCNVTGTIGDKSINGEAYVEMTGYAAAFSNEI